MLEKLAEQIAKEAGQLSKGAHATVQAIELIVAKLTSLQTPDQIIEIKLSPMIQGLTRAVNTFSKGAEAQAKAVDANIKQTQEISNAIAELLSEIRRAQAGRYLDRDAKN
jgi:hypothetical protein